MLYSLKLWIEIAENYDVSVRICWCWLREVFWLFSGSQLENV